MGVSSARRWGKPWPDGRITHCWIEVEFYGHWTFDVEPRRPARPADRPQHRGRLDDFEVKQLQVVINR
jgi:hypothetical protein